MFVTRIEQFSAAHRLHSTRLSDEENAALYGKCNHINGHGHNYRVEVTVVGPVDELTGMVVNLVELRDCIWKWALNDLDHRNLDKDIDFFKDGTVSTTENVAKCIWQRLAERIPPPAQLFEITVHETDKNYARYRGGGTATST